MFDRTIEMKNNTQEKIKQTPPKGVIIPKKLLFVKHKIYKDPENKISPIKQVKNAYLTNN